MQAENAPLVQIQHAERQLERLPTSEADARRAYQKELQRASDQARPLAGLAPQSEPPGDDAAGAEVRRNFIALVFCLMLGTAAMPHVLTRYYTTPSVAATRDSVGWSLLFIVLLYVSAPALAVMVKYQVVTELVGTSFGSLPDWLRRWSKLDPNLVSVRDVNGDGVLQLAELHLGSDLLVLAAPELGGMPLVVTYLVAAGGLAAALSTADGLLLTISNTLSHDLVFRLFSPRASAIQRVMLSKLIVLAAAVLAAWVASLRLTDILPFVAAAFSVAAATFFPALVFGVFWRRANRVGAVAGMVVGAGVCLGYMAVNQPGLREWAGAAAAAGDWRWFGIDPRAAGVFGVPAGAVTLVLVSLITRPPGPDEMALVDRLRRPGTPPSLGYSGTHSSL